MKDPTVSPLVVEIAKLQQESDRADESIGDKLDQLEDAGWVSWNLLNASKMRKITSTLLKAR